MGDQNGRLRLDVLLEGPPPLGEGGDENVTTSPHKKISENEQQIDKPSSYINDAFAKKIHDSFLKRSLH